MLKATFGKIRPVFIIIAAWVMATSQVLRKHTASLVQYNAFLLLPAYHVFYQGLLISALFSISHRHTQRERESGAMRCVDYKIETRAKFGFIKNPDVVKRFTITSLLIFFVSLLFGVIAAYLIKNDVRSWRPKNLREYRATFARYSTLNIGVCLLVYFVAFNAISQSQPAETWGEIDCPISDTRA